MRMKTLAWVASTLAVSTAVGSALAAPRQRIESPWDVWSAIKIPPLVTALVANGAIKAVEIPTSITTGKSLYSGPWSSSTDGAWLLGAARGHYGCEGTQVHSAVGLISSWETRTSPASGKTLTKSWPDMKLAKAADLQKLCDAKGTWHATETVTHRVVRKQFTASYQVQLTATCKAPLAPTRHPTTAEQYSVTAVCETAMFDRFALQPLYLHWSGTLQDNLTTSAESQSGYTRMREEGRLYKDPGSGRAPLKLFYSATRKDYFTASTAKGIADAKAAGYVDKGIVGYVYSSQQKGTRPLKLFWSASRQDNITVSTQQGQKDAQSAGYVFVRDEGYVII